MDPNLENEDYKRGFRDGNAAGTGHGLTLAFQIVAGLTFVSALIHKNWIVALISGILLASTFYTSYRILYPILIILILASITICITITALLSIAHGDYIVCLLAISTIVASIWMFKRLKNTFSTNETSWKESLIGFFIIFGVSITIAKLSMYLGITW
ncbi:MAG: hypothetical protein M0011_05220 [Elusimicrobia bacterium]|nr:hypothetical protein [Elusimicrobiota bacterium]